MEVYEPKPDRVEPLDTENEAASYGGSAPDAEALGYDGVTAGPDDGDYIPEEAPEAVSAPAEATAGGWPAAARALLRAELTDDMLRGDNPADRQ
jgi:hypothetical protein